MTPRVGWMGEVANSAAAAFCATWKRRGPDGHHHLIAGFEFAEAMLAVIN